MSNQYNYLTVILEKDVRDARTLIEAIKQLRGVRSVKPNKVNSDLTEKFWREVYSGNWPLDTLEVKK